MRLVLLALVLFLAPLTAGIALTEARVLIYRVIVVPSDVPLAALVIVVALRAIRRRSLALGPGAAVFAVLVALLAVSFAVQPSAIGAQTVLRMTGTLAVALTVASLAPGGERTFVALTLGAVAVAETAVAFAQVLAGGPVGAPGEAPAPLLVQGTSVLPRGTFLHPYPLAGWGLVAAAVLARRAVASARPWPWIAAAAAAVAPVGVVYSRAALAGLLAGVAAFASRWRSPVHRAAALALLLGALVPAFAWSGGWIVRAEQDVEQTDTSNSYRLLLQDEALTLIRERPVLGVGTGGFVAAVERRFPDAPRSAQPVHSVPLIVAAEAGVAAGLVCVALLAVLLARAVRSGPAAVALFLMFVPYVLLDVYPYVGWQGPAILGVWIGALDLRSSRETPSP